jgi:mannonate dehydratase
MNIVDARVIVTCPGRNFVSLKIVTDDGVTGAGDATLNGRRIEDTWQYRYQGTYWRSGPVTMSAIAAVEDVLVEVERYLRPVNRLEDRTVHPW